MNENDIRWLIREFMNTFASEAPKTEEKAAPATESKTAQTTEKELNQKIEALTAKVNTLTAENAKLNQALDAYENTHKPMYEHAIQDMSRNTAKLIAENENLRKEIAHRDEILDKKVDEQIKKVAANAGDMRVVSEIWEIAINCLNDIYKAFAATTKEDFNKCNGKEFMDRFVKNCTTPLTK